MLANPLLADLNRPNNVWIMSEMAAERLIEVGANVLPDARPTPWWQRGLRQLHNPIIYILLFALAFDVVMWTKEGMHGWPIESIAILVILTLNFIIVASVALQMLTITVPALRAMLGLVPLDGVVLGLVVAALGVTIIGEEIWSRRVIRDKPRNELQTHPAGVNRSHPSHAEASHRP